MRSHNLKTNLLLRLCATFIVVLPCAAQTPSEHPNYPQRLAIGQLPNPVSICDKVISGGLPEGEAAFAQLAHMGVKTIISVDGAKPDVASAEKFGMRYVHLPHGYDGIPDQRVVELAKAVTDLDGPIYVHCHHGKHRSPAAAAVACVAAGLIDRETSENVLKVAGTSEEYRGLFHSVKAAHRLSAAELQSTQVSFQPVAPLPPMAEMMVELEHAFDHLRKLDSDNWRLEDPTASSEAAHSALMLEESFREVLRVATKAGEDQRYLRLLEESLKQSERLQHALADYRDHTQPSQLAAASTELARISTNCKACHSQFRDIPLGEKLKR